MIQRLLAAVFVSVLYTGAQGQQPAAALRMLRDSFPQEKMHIHFDRNAYGSGETVFFKAYLFSGFMPSFLSTNFYGELLNEQGGKILSVRFPVLTATVSGSFDLPKELPAGTYLFRAYTPWMLNFDAGFLYSRVITVYNDRTAITKETEPGRQVRLQFFPEGGNLVPGTVNVLAFKATDQFGDPVSIGGKLMDEQGNELAELVTQHDGMGKFGFMPAPGKSYHAKVQAGNGPMLDVPLPEASAIPWAMQVRAESDNRLRVILMTTPPATEKKIILIGQMQQELLFEQEMPVEGNAGMLILDTRNFPAGILQVTALTPSGNPLAERLVFIHSKESVLPVSLKADHFSAAPRAETTLKFSLPDSVLGSFSVSVVDQARVPDQLQQESIVSRLLLTGDLSGYINEPEYYFSADSREVRQAMDLLLMTQGWRRFSWGAITRKQYPRIRFIDKSHIDIKGKAVFSSTKKPVTEGFLNIILRTKNSENDFLQAPVSSDGSFLLQDLVFSDSASFSYQYNSSKTKEKSLQLSIVYDTSEVAAVHEYVRSVPVLHSGRKLQLADSFRVSFTFAGDTTGLYKELEEITVTAKKRKPVEELNRKYATGLFSSTNMVNIIDLVNTKDVTGALNVFQYIQGRLPGIMVNTAGNPPTYQVYSRKAFSLTGGAIPVPLYLNEVAVDARNLEVIPMNEVAMIKYFQTGFMGNPGVGTTQAIVVYTRKGEDARPSATSYLNSFRYPGYNVVREFYQPDYGNAKRKYPQPDKRVTLYWQADLKPDEGTNEYTIRFYNSDFGRRFHVTLEGFTSDGKLVHEELDLH